MPGRPSNFGRARRSITPRRARTFAVPGVRGIGLGASAAGVLLFAAGIAILAGTGGHPSSPDHVAGARLVRSTVAAAAPISTAPISTAVANTAAVATAAAHTAPGASVAAYPPAYPPRNPCSLSLARAAGDTGSTSDTSTSDTTVEGDGLGAGQTVTVDYYADPAADAATLGSWRTDGTGSFTASVDVPDPSGDAAFLTARSPSARCTTPAGSRDPGSGYPPSTSSSGPPTSAPNTGSTTPATSAGPTTGPTTGSSPTSGPTAPTGGDSSGSTTGTGSEPSSGTLSPGSTSSATGSSAATSGASSQGPGSSSSPTTPSSQGATVSTTGGSTSSTQVSPSPSTTPVSISAQSWGLPASFIVTMALVLLLLGGLAVLVLTRRSG